MDIQFSFDWMALKDGMWCYMLRERTRGARSMTMDFYLGIVRLRFIGFQPRINVLGEKSQGKCKPNHQRSLHVGCKNLLQQDCASDESCFFFERGTSPTTN